MERYLGSGLIKGIGPAYAARIVARFGLETLDILENDPDRLSEVAGLGRTRVERIKKAWQEQKEIHRIMVFLQGHGISATYAVKIFKTYGRKSLTVRITSYNVCYTKLLREKIFHRINERKVQNGSQQYSSDLEYCRVRMPLSCYCSRREQIQLIQGIDKTIDKK